MPDSKSAVVVFTDIVGFNALKTHNEEQAQSLLHKNFVLQKNIIDKYEGEIVSIDKDEILVTFHSKLSAVKCSVAIQQEVQKVGYSLRIGIHSGKLHCNTDDYKGEAVIVARFLQTISDKGGITVSEKIRESNGSNKDISFESSGRKQIENLNKSIEVFKIRYPVSSSEIDYLQHRLKRKVWLPFIILGIIVVLFILLTLLRKVL